MKSNADVDVEALLAELEEARETLRALKQGDVDALVVTEPATDDDKIYALQGMQKIAQSIFEQSAEAIVVCDTAGTITKASEVAHEISVVNPILQPFEHVFPLRMAGAGQNSSVRYFSINEVLKGNAERGLEVEFTSVKNRRFVLLLSAAPLRDGTDTTYGCIVVLTDITAQKQAQDELRVAVEREKELRMQLQAASEIREQFISVVSHELRTPLMAILGWAQILQRHDPHEQDRLSNGLKIIERNAKSQARIVDDLLDISRIITGKLRLDIIRVNLHRLITEVLDSARPSAELKNVSLTFVPATDETVVNADKERLNQVIGNLITNAIKFTPPMGKVSVTTRITGTHVEIEIADTGVGIEPDFLPHVFERFRQADSSTTRSTTGLGLGLAIVRSIVELHQGTVSARSEGLDKGAIFTVRLPLAASNT